MVLQTDVITLLQEDSLQQLLSATNKLPDSLYESVVTHTLAGTMTDKAESICEYRTALLQGRLPSTTTAWPLPVIQDGINQGLTKLGLARHCKDNPEVTDAVLLDVLNILEKKSLENNRLYQHLLQQKKQTALQNLAQDSAETQSQTKHKKRKKNKQGNKEQQASVNPLLGGTGGESISTTGQLPTVVWEELVKQAEKKSWQQTMLGFEADVENHWGEHLTIWQQLEALFGDLQLVTKLGFDLSRGFFQSHGWLNLVELQEVVAKLPKLAQVIQTLGRMKVSDGKPIIETVFETVKRKAAGKQLVKTPFLPMEMRGITRSDSIARMLPQEAAYLGHPILKTLWHARRAEHALLSYAVEGTTEESIDMEVEIRIEIKRAGKSKYYERGPILICLDTSGSMSGLPENVAKAIVLQALVTASTEQRACYVYLFGSVREVKELELKPDASGLDSLISFLCMSFGGGTDVNGPLEMALEQSKKSKWKDADILLVSDGEFVYPKSLVSNIKRRKTSHGLKVHGILIGQRSTAMEGICDPVYMFDEWSELAGY